MLIGLIFVRFVEGQSYTNALISSLFIETFILSSSTKLVIFILVIGKVLEDSADPKIKLRRAIFSCIVPAMPNTRIADLS